MTLIALGINHRTAALETRERVAFAPELMMTSLQEGLIRIGGEDFAILSTCNRTELYGSGDVDVSRAMLAWLASERGLDETELEASCYIHQGDAAVQHMMKVACGLDSMVLGEPQILGQMKSAFAVAEEAGTISGPLHQVFQQVFATAKRVRTETAIGENPVSVAYAAVSLAQQIFSSMQDVHALLIGAGETVELLARHLREQGVGRITVANRTLSRAQEMAEKFSADAILLSDIHDRLHEADVVISSTASQLPVLGKGAVESALKKRKHKPIFMVDIAVPRDIEPEVGQLDDIYLYTVDDLKSVIEVNLRQREDAADQAEVIIDEGVASWQKQLRGQSVASTIRAFRENLGAVRDAELDKALAALSQGQSSEQVLRQLAHGLTNKILHTPTTQLKKASELGNQAHIRWTQELFGLLEPDQDITEDYADGADKLDDTETSTSTTGTPKDNTLNDSDKQDGQ
ncbi:MAG: glutamyl-tRNA reductase [Porticoccaceae bacterium]|nr:glutamyl-tRNA reductase [Porticoccaceae bacterium]